jgi:hypothetical protein
MTKTSTRSFLLQRALREVPPEFPVRGPAAFTEGHFSYQNAYEGVFVDDRAALTPFAVPVDIQTREARPGIRVLPNVKRG